MLAVTRLHAPFLFSARVLSTRRGVQVKQIDFSDPQAREGFCDWKAAQVNAHVKS